MHQPVVRPARPLAPPRHYRPHRRRRPLPLLRRLPPQRPPAPEPPLPHAPTLPYRAPAPPPAPPLTPPRGRTPYSQWELFAVLGLYLYERASLALPVITDATLQRSTMADISARPSWAKRIAL